MWGISGGRCGILRGLGGEGGWRLVFFFVSLFVQLFILGFVMFLEPVFFLFFAFFIVSFSCIRRFERKSLL